MIVGRLSKSDSYGIYSEDIKQGLEYLKGLNVDIPVGSYTISEKIYANVMEYQTQEESGSGYEAHRTHLDIHYVLSGKERIKWASIEDMRIMTPYDSERDAAFYNAIKEDGTGVVLEGDKFAIMFPYDGHSCQFNVFDREKIKKVVVKILI